MKKVFLLLIALVLMLSGIALAEEAELPSMDIEPSYEGTTVEIPDTGLTFLLPNDWVPTPPAEGATGIVFISPDGKTVLNVQTVAQVLDDSIPQFDALVKEGKLKSSQYVLINGVQWLVWESGDGLQSGALTQMDEANVLSFTFVTAEVVADSSLGAEIVSTVTAAE